MKYSHQREVILDIVKSSKSHLTAQDVYERVKEIIPNISLGTVYRNLNFLSEQQFIRRIIVPAGSDEFDYCPSEHSHFFCMRCHNLFDLEKVVDDKIKKVIEEMTGYEMTNAGVVFQGICQECQEKKEG